MLQTNSIFSVRCIFIIVSLLLFACCNNKKAGRKIPHQAELNEPLIAANKIYAKKEADEIEQYIRLRNWNMLSTGTGLRYMIYKKGEGAQAQSHKYANVKYKISLLNGSLCYSSDQTGPKEFLIDEDNVESGLHEGIKYLSVGDKAMFIIPSHLAHGLIGDANKIPPKATLVFDVELLAVR